jgi:broad specificity phosphatase PhoE
MLGRSTTMLLLRHGQSEWNAAHRWQGAADTPLTPVGRRQATTAANRLRQLGIEFCGPWSSDLGRARATAATIATALEIGPTRADPRLREANAGEWEGLTRDEIEVHFPGWLAARRRPDSFEPFEHVVGRALVALRAIADSAPASGATPLVVTHSGVIRSVVRHLGGPDTRIPNLGGVWLSVDLPSITGSSGADPARPGIDILDPAGMSVGNLFDPHGSVERCIGVIGEDPR